MASWTGWSRQGTRSRKLELECTRSERVMRQWVRYWTATKEESHITRETGRNQKTGMRQPEECRTLITESRDFRHPFHHLRGR